MRFMVLPDLGQPREVSGLNLRGSKRLRHPSGRTWLLGDWEDDELVHAAGDRAALAVLGVSDITRDGLRACLEAPSPRRALRDLTRRAAGSFHVICSIDGDTWAHGTASAVCQLFHASVGSVGLVSSSAAVLAESIGAALQPSGVAVHLLAPSAPWPLDETTIWEGVTALQCGQEVRLSTTGSLSFDTWWSPPQAELDSHEAAQRLGVALEDAVAARTQRSRSLSCDLSGGLDSTSVAFIAARTGATLTTFREGSNDPAHDDWRWAAMAAEHLPGRHVVVDLAETPSDFDPVPPSASDGEGPFAWERARASLRAAALRAVAAGSRDHLTGHGGDEVFDVGPSNDHSAFQAGALRYARLSAASRLNGRWSVRGQVRMLRDRTPYQEWLLRAADDLRRDVASSPPTTGVWGPSPLLAPWMTVRADELVKDRLVEAARTTEALSDWRAQHSLVAGARQCGAAVRRSDWITREVGVRWHAPLLDDRVIEAELATSFDARVSAAEYKPTLVAGMGDRVPRALLERPTKADFSQDMYHAIRRHRSELVGWCDELRLGELGLVDPLGLRASIVGSHPTPPSMIQLFTTLAAESWLRAAVRPDFTREGKSA